VVTVTARDATGNEATCQFDVTVALPVALDVRPSGCPNSIKTSEDGVLPVAIMGSALFDVNRIDPASVRLLGVAPLRWRRGRRRAVPAMVGKDDCLDCNALKKDRVGDLAFKFSAPALVAALEKVTDGECRVVRLTGTTTDGCPVAGEDVVRLLANGRDLASGEAAVSVEAARQSGTPDPPRRAAQSALAGHRDPLRAAGRGAGPLDIFDVVGRRVRSIVDGVVGPGSHTANWDGTDAAGLPVTNGVYFYVLAVEDGTHHRQVRKLIVSR
jgi:hypothetical protein